MEEINYLTEEVTTSELKLRGKIQISNWGGHVRTYVKQFNKVGGIFQ